jgi:hypothetical protein
MVESITMVGDDITMVGDDITRQEANETGEWPGFFFYNNPLMRANSGLP